jgi:hypothetical protein
MKIKTIQTSGWIELKKAEDEIEQDAGTAELRRVLSAAVRSQHLVVLTGLGTSLCVKKNGKRLAPTMDAPTPSALRWLGFARATEYFSNRGYELDR